LVHFSPWRGRLYFQLYQPDSLRTLRFLEPTIGWFSERKETFNKCRVVSDDATLYGITSSVAIDLTKNTDDVTFSRPIPIFYIQGRSSLNELLYDLNVNGSPPLCGILYADPSKVPSAPSSPIAKSSKHWLDEYGNISKLVLPKSYAWAEELTSKRGWKKTPVPPFYNYYTPPVIP
jgi:hypothetical protein